MDASLGRLGSLQEEGLGSLHVALADYQAKSRELRQLSALKAPALVKLEGPGIGRGVMDGEPLIWLMYG